MTHESNDDEGRDNVGRIHQLVRMMRKYDLSAIDLVEGDTSIRLRRRGVEVLASHQVPIAATVAPAAHTPPVSREEARTVDATPAPAATRGTAIESPMVGTFFSSSSPENPPFVTVGSVVRAESTVCIIEAMKVFTEIPAGVSGTIVEVLAKDKQAVEYGQPLFRVEAN